MKQPTGLNIDFTLEYRIQEEHLTKSQRSFRTCIKDTKQSISQNLYHRYAKKAPAAHVEQSSYWLSYTGTLRLSLSFHALLGYLLKIFCPFDGLGVCVFYVTSFDRCIF